MDSRKLDQLHPIAPLRLILSDKAAFSLKNLLVFLKQFSNADVLDCRRNIKLKVAVAMIA